MVPQPVKWCLSSLHGSSHGADAVRAAKRTTDHATGLPMAWGGDSRSRLPETRRDTASSVTNATIAMQRQDGRSDRPAWNSCGAHGARNQNERSHREHLGLLNHLGHAEHPHNAAAKTTEPANLTGQTEALPVHPDPGLKLGDRHLVEVASPKQISTDNKTER